MYLEQYFIYGIIGWNHFEYGPRSKHPIQLPDWASEFGTEAQLIKELTIILNAGKQKQEETKRKRRTRCD